ncbi:uncharacterized protein PV09_02229 [Verruconis gallopava]|uniref:Alcohol dehydrogenase-like C-terminal domain-containing protein n=1 Tax=Verruconis gallopava TaxID=253628 RepID=A0A0D1XX75_9PEZI|nr:uncharacterized protein PV09_02229 [Verruconis gallopava]KIW07386.1 hypothetical protein PV09_02229 [Verruconis gallopava]
MVDIGSVQGLAILFLQEGPTRGLIPAPFFILRGSSELGASAIQLLQLAVPNCELFATTSQQHHKMITKQLGVDVVFDRSSPSLINDIKAATRSSEGVDAILEAVGAGSVEKHIFDAFAPKGPKRYAQVWTGGDEIRGPAGVDPVLFQSRDSLEIPGGKIFFVALQVLLAEGRYKPPLPLHKVGEELDSLKSGLDLMRKGVSGEKLVVLYKTSHQPSLPTHMR